MRAPAACDLCGSGYVLIMLLRGRDDLFAVTKHGSFARLLLRQSDCMYERTLISSEMHFPR